LLPEYTITFFRLSYLFVLPAGEAEEVQEVVSHPEDDARSPYLPQYIPLAGVDFTVE
jgi:hypothetical protein